MSRIVVVVAEGAVTPAEMLVGLSFCDELIFATLPGAFAESVTPLLALAGTVVPIAHDDDADLARLRALRPDAILTFSERALRLTARFAEGLGLRGHRLTTVDRLTDKHRQRECLIHVGHSVRSALLTHGADWEAALGRVGLPAVIKPAHGEGSRNTFLVTDSQAGSGLVTQLLEREGQLVLEEYLEGRPSLPLGDYVSVESATVDSRVHHLGITSKMPMLPPFRETSNVHPDHLDEALRSEILQLTGDALRAIGVENGITHTEIKLTQAGPRLIEVNGRVGGYINELYQRARGVNLVELAARIACGEQVTLKFTDQPGVHFQHFSLPPRWATELLSVTGGGQLRRHPNIVSYKQFVPAGTRIPSDARSYHLDMVCGTAPSHEAIASTLDDCLPALVFTFDSVTGPRTVTGADLLLPTCPEP